MSFVAVAIGGAAVVGAVGSNLAANRAGRAAEAGADAAAQAQIISTELQIEEIARQYDYQQQILLPQIQQQYNAQGAFADLLGIGGPQVGQNQQTGFTPQARPRAEEERYRQGEIDNFDQMLAQGQISAEEHDRYVSNIRNRPYDQERIAQENLARGPQFPGRGATDFARGPQGEFIDPNLDPTRLADVNTYGDAVRGNLLAGTAAEDDPYRNYIDQNRIAAATADEDARVARARDVTLTGTRGDALLAEGAAGTGVYGETFEESPGYAFAVEEANRATDRLRSRGGNYGGRAIIEAQRRAVGLANQEYYNYAAGRERDLARLGAAEAADAGRLDAFAASDIARGDQALAGYETQRIADVGRGDQAYQDYLRRREGDVARLDAAAMQEDQLIAADRARSDQAYYNYIRNLGMVAGFGGGPAATAVDASQAAGAQTAGAYRAQGSNLAGIYGGLGQTQAQIEGQRTAGITNAITGGISNFLTYRGSQPTQPPIGVAGRPPI